MAKDERHWCAVNPMKNWRLDGLTQSEVEVLVATLGELERKNCWLWKKGWDKWSKLPEVSKQELNQERSFRSADHPPEPPEIARIRPRTAWEYDSEITQVEVQKQENQETHRKHPRYAVALPVSIVSGNQSFKTMSEDISLGGICLQDALPDWVAGYLTVMIETPQDGTIEVVCTVVEDQGRDGKYRMEIVPSVKFDALKSWIEKQLSS